MFATRRNLVLSATGAALVAAVAVFPIGASFAADRAPTPSISAPALPYELDAMAPPSIGHTAPAPTQIATALPPIGNSDAEAQRCMAKIVHHEARNQPRAGMVAVAQTLVNRLKAGGRFGGTICQVASQRGQFFDIQAYHPREDSADWHTAMDVAQATLSGTAEPVAPGAMFFRAAYRPASTFFRTRERVAAVGDQVFYR